MFLLYENEIIKLNVTGRNNQNEVTVKSSSNQNMAFINAVLNNYLKFTYVQSLAVNVGQNRGQDGDQKPVYNHTNNHENNNEKKIVEKDDLKLKKSEFKLNLDFNLHTKGEAGDDVLIFNACFKDLSSSRGSYGDYEYFCSLRKLACHLKKHIGGWEWWV